MDDPPAADSAGWAAYHAATRDGPPRPLLVEALALQPRPGDALDLGCGAGNDTRYLLDAGFRVTAVDADPDAIAALQALGHPRLTAICSTFAAFPFDPAGYDLVSAQYALPFNPPATFPAMAARLTGALRPGALFCGQLFGVRDAWNVAGTALTFHTRDEAEALFAGLEIIAFREIEEVVRLASGDPHQAHAFEIIARRSA